MGRYLCYDCQGPMDEIILWNGAAVCKDCATERGWTGEREEKESLMGLEEMRTEADLKWIIEYLFSDADADAYLPEDAPMTEKQKRLVVLMQRHFPEIAKEWTEVVDENGIRRALRDPPRGKR